MDQHSWIQDAVTVGSVVGSLVIAGDQIRRMRSDIRDLWSSLNDLRDKLTAAGNETSKLAGVVDEMRRAR